VKIAVCVKEVPEAGAARRIDPRTMRLDRSGEAALNAFDVNAVEEALRVKEAQGRPRWSSSRWPGPRARLAAQGARDGRRPGVLVADEARPARTWSRPAALLRRRSSRESADLVLFGQQSSDSDGAVLWAAVADRLRLPLISQAAELDVADGKAT
jgi:electron transfer flavoprotein beta subunit